MPANNRPGNLSSRLLYGLASHLVRVVLAIFFSRVEQVGAEKIPGDAPILFAANHPNEMLDPFLVGNFHRGRVNFLGKSTLFAFPPFGWVLRSLGVIPVYRRRDAEREMGKNEDSFRECFERLEAREAIGIFPEGTSHAGPSLLPLKTGAARIVLSAEERNDYSLGVRIVPVGLNFMDRDEFRSDALAVYGDPIDPSPYFDLHRRDPQQAARDLTAEVEQALRSLTVNLREKDDELFLERLKKVFKHELPGYFPGDGPENQFELSRQIVDAWNRMLQKDPGRVQRLRRKITGYFRLIRTSRIRPGVARMSTLQVLAHLAWTIPAGLVGLPIAAHGALHNWLAYRLPGWYTAWTGTEEVEQATFKIAIGLVSFPLFYTLQGLLVAGLLGGPLAIVYVATLPVTGLFALAYFESARVFVTGSRSFFAFLTNLDLKARIETMRCDLKNEIQSVADEYLAEQS